jgi:hypothetical protein
VPSFGLLFWSAIEYALLKNPSNVRTLGYFLLDYVAACGVGITALFASIALPRTRKRDVAILFGACGAGVVALYAPSLFRAWPLIRAKDIPKMTAFPLGFPFALLFLSACAALLGRRRKPVVTTGGDAGSPPP